jgi:hypothetical protein
LLCPSTIKNIGASSGSAIRLRSHRGVVSILRPFFQGTDRICGAVMWTAWWDERVSPSSG